MRALVFPAVILGCVLVTVLAQVHRNAKWKCVDETRVYAALQAEAAARRAAHDARLSGIALNAPVVPRGTVGLLDH